MAVKPDWIFEKRELSAVLRQMEFSPELCRGVEDLADELGANHTNKENFLQLATAYLKEGICPEDAPEDVRWRVLLALTGYPCLLQDALRLSLADSGQ